jgi:hypothetical protein
MEPYWSLWEKRKKCTPAYTHQNNLLSFELNEKINKSSIIERHEYVMNIHLYMNMYKPTLSNPCTELSTLINPPSREERIQGSRNLGMTGNRCSCHTKTQDSKTNKQWCVFI